MFKNWFRSANEKRMEEQIAKLREDIIILQTQINDLMNKPSTLESTLDNVLEPRMVEPIKEEPTPIKEELVIKEEPTPIKEELVIKEPTPIKEEPVVVTIEKVLEQAPTVEKETNTVPPKKRRQSKKAAQLEEALPKLTV